MALGRRERLLGAAVAVGVSYAALRSRRAQELDRQAGRALSRPLGPVADRIIGAGTDLGSVYAIGGLSAVLAATGRRDLAVDVAGAGATGWVVAQAIKPLVERPRPYQADGLTLLVAAPAGHSWPSGHVAVAGAMAGAITPAMPTRGRVGAALAAAFVCLSRIYVGVHYVTDVVAGLGVGVLSAEAWRAVRRRVRRGLEARS